MANQAARLLAQHLMEEVLQGASACICQRQQQFGQGKDEQGDRPIPADYVEIMLEYTTQMKPYRTSMKIDYDERRPLEIEAILGCPLRRATAAGARLPRIKMLYHQLQFLDQQNRQSTE